MPSVYNFAYLKALVLAKVQGDAFFDTQKIEDALNEAQDDLALHTKAGLTSEDVALTVGQDIYPWPAAAFIIDGLNYNGVELDQMTQEEWRRRGGINQIAPHYTTGPTGYAIMGNTFILYPKPIDNSIPVKVFYVPRPTPLTADNQVPDVDRAYTKAWVHLALSNLLEMDAGRLQEAEHHYQMYLKKRAENAVNMRASAPRKFHNTPPRSARP